VRHRGVPWWFGDDEDVPPSLRASVEPIGLQVCGVLPEADWCAWDEKFRGRRSWPNAGHHRLCVRSTTHQAA
jgi:hypothetical protein